MKLKMCDVAGQNVKHDYVRIMIYIATFAQVMACCLTAPSHSLDQCWVLIWEILRRTLQNDFTANVQAAILLV